MLRLKDRRLLSYEMLTKPLLFRNNHNKISFLGDAQGCSCHPRNGSVSWRSGEKGGGHASHWGGKCLSLRLQLWGRSVPSISKFSWKVRTRFPWKQWGTMNRLTIHCRLKRLPWASWKSNHSSFQVLNNGSRRKLFNHKLAIIWGRLVHN